MINFKSVWRVIGYLIILIGILQIPSAIFSYFFESEDLSAFLISMGIALTIGTILSRLKHDTKKGVKKREGYLIVAFGWISMCLFSMLPYLFSGVIPAFHDALFESVSGLTTSGATILTDIESMPHGVLLWRSTTQWIGGMGIIVLTVALFPLLGIGGIELFVAETPGPTSDKLHPRIQGTAKRLWLLYLMLSVLVILIYWIEGMNFFDAYNHGLTTIASGGFSTKNTSMSHFTSPLIQYTCIFFMMLAAVNFSLIYHCLKGNFKKMFWNDEFRAYVAVILLFSCIVSVMLYVKGGYAIEETFRLSLFNVTSVITTTGFATADFSSWSHGITFVFLILFFVGGCAASTSGGIKIIRHIVFFKHVISEFKRIFHPQAIVPLKINNKSVSPRIVSRIMTFLLVYLLLVLTGTLVLSLSGIDFNTALGAVAASIGNVGPGIGAVGPMDNFAWLSPGIKIFLSFLMMVGRLELFTILIIFTPYFWKLN